MTTPATAKLRIEQIVGIALVALLTIGTLYFLSPFMPAILYAVILTVSTWPVFEWLRQHLKGSATAAAAVMTLFFVALLVVPIVFLSVTLVDEVPPLVDAAKDLFAHGLPLAPAWLTDLPIIGVDRDRAVEGARPGHASTRRDDAPVDRQGR